MSFYRVVESVAMSSCYWCEASCRWWLDLSPVGYSFFSSFSLLLWKLQLVGISTSVPNLLISHFYLGSFIGVFVFNFILDSQFTKYYILQFDPYSLNFLFFSSVLLWKFYQFLISSFNSNWWYHIFQFDPYCFGF
jgi:hypothetical protein